MTARINKATESLVVECIKAGKYLSDIARTCGVSTSSVRAIADRNGVTYNIAPASVYQAAARKGNAKMHGMLKLSPVITPEQECCRRMASLRWGGGLGS